jgi:superfamily II DNA/RNA helicase
LQVYVHRSGRTARAGQKGSTLSLVSPEDTEHHAQVCHSLQVPSLPTLRMDLSSAPVVKERVRLAKRIFTESFVSSQKSKEKNWLETSARDADLVIDEMLYDEIGTKQQQQQQQPLPLYHHIVPHRKQCTMSVYLCFEYA